MPAVICPMFFELYLPNPQPFCFPFFKSFILPNCLPVLSDFLPRERFGLAWPWFTLNDLKIRKHPVIYNSNSCVNHNIQHSTASGFNADTGFVVLYCELKLSWNRGGEVA